VVWFNPVELESEVEGNEWWKYERHS
jgi:hypothetical protein